MNGAMVAKIHTAALKYAERLRTPDFDAVVDRSLKAIEDVNRSAPMIMQSWRKMFTEAELDSFPIPGSDSGNNPDKAKDGERSAGYYDELFANSDRGRESVEVKKQCKLADNNSKDADDDYLGLSATERATLYDTAEQRLRNGASLFRKAAALHFMLRKCQAFEHVTVRLETLPNGEPVASKKPIFIQNKDDLSKWDFIPVSTLLGFEPDKVKDDGDAYLNLRKSGKGKGKKKREGATEPGANKKTTIGSVEQFWDYAGELVRFLEDATHRKSVNASLHGTGSDDNVWTLGELERHILPMTVSTEARYEQVQLNRAGQQSPEAKAIEAEKKAQAAG